MGDLKYFINDILIASRSVYSNDDAKLEFEVLSSLSFEDPLQSQSNVDLRSFRMWSLLGETVVSHEPLVSGIVGEGLRADDEEHPPADAPSSSLAGTWWGRFDNSNYYNQISI